MVKNEPALHGTSCPKLLTNIPQTIDRRRDPEIDRLEQECDPFVPRLIARVSPRLPAKVKFEVKELERYISPNSRAAK